MRGRPGSAARALAVALAVVLGPGLALATDSGPVTGSSATAGSPPGPNPSTRPRDQEIVERIVSVVPAATEALFALGAGDKVVGVGSYDTWPDEVRDRPEVGGYVDPNYERIVALRPDLVVLDAGQSAMARRLRRAGIAIFPFPHGDLEVAFETMGALGKAVGMPEAGRRLVQRVRERLEELRTRHRRDDRPRVLLVFGRGGGGFRSVWVVGGTGFLHRLLEIAGGENVFGDVAHASFKVGLETLLARRPDVVLEIAASTGAPAGEAPVDPGPVREEWRSLPGYDDVRVAVLTADHVGRPGPRMPETVELMARALHGGEGGGPEPSGSARRRGARLR